MGTPHCEIVFFLNIANILFQPADQEHTVISFSSAVLILPALVNTPSYNHVLVFIVVKYLHVLLILVPAPIWATSVCSTFDKLETENWLKQVPNVLR